MQFFLTLVKYNICVGIKPFCPYYADTHVNWCSNSLYIENTPLQCPVITKFFILGKVFGKKVSDFRKKKYQSVKVHSGETEGKTVNNILNYIRRYIRNIIIIIMILFIFQL